MEQEYTTEEVFGMHPIMEAISAGKEFDKLFIQKSLKGDLSQELWNLVRKHRINYKLVPVEKLNRLTRKNHQGVFGFISPVSFHNTGELLMSLYEQGKNPLLLVLDRVSDVRNFGAIARTAECAGVDAIILPALGAAQINGDAMKTSAGALHNIPLCREKNMENCISFLKESGLKIVACTEQTDQELSDADMTEPTAIIMGSEENGVSPELLKASNVRAKIPMLGKTGSLNVSVAAGIIIYEAVRQRMNK